MAIVAAGIVTGYEWQPDLRFMVQLDIYSYTSENFAPGILTSQSFSVEDPEGFVNSGIYTFVRNLVTGAVDDGGWGMTLAVDDTIEIINPYQKAPPSTILSSKFSAFWKLDEDTASHLLDTYASFDLTMGGVVEFIPGYIGTAAHFQAGGSTSLTRAYDAALNPTDGLTFSCWLKLTYPEPGVRGIAGTWVWNTNKGWALEVDDAGALVVFVASDAGDAGDNYGTTQATGFYDDVWHHVVVRINPAGATDADRLTITVDDVLQTLDFTGTIPAAIMDDGGAFTIGYFRNYAEGLIDECELRGIGGALIAQWKFDGGSRLDLIADNHLSEVGSVTREATSDGSYAAVFNGAKNVLFIDDSSDLVSGDFDWTIALWIKPGVLDGYPILSSWYIDADPGQSRAVFELRFTSGSLQLKVHDGTTLNVHEAYNSLAEVDLWSFIVLRYDSATDTISVKVNQQAAEAFVLAAPILNDSNRFVVGGLGSIASSYFNGAIRRFGYAPRLLTDAEVVIMYDSGAGQDWPFEDVPELIIGTSQIADGAVTYAKIQDLSVAPCLLGRGSMAGAGAVEEITIGNNLQLSDTTLHAVMAAHGTSHEDAGADEITVAGLSGLLADGQTPLAHADSHHAAGSDPVAIATADIVDDAVTYAKMQDVSATDRLLGRDTAGAGDVEEIAPAAVLAMLGAFSSVTLQAFTTVGANTYTPTAGMKSCIVITTGSGGGGGGADTAGGSADVGVGGGGGAGGTCIEAFSAATIGASQTVTIGVAGTVGSATNGTAGGAGGNTTFGALHTANGGAGGTGSGASAVDFQTIAGGAGGVPTGGLANITGGSGGAGNGSSGGTTITIGEGGDGGASFWGGGGQGGKGANIVVTTDVNAAGGAGLAYGSGGGGACSLNSTTGAAGGIGMLGFCLVIELG